MQKQKTGVENNNLDQFIRAAFHQNGHITRRSESQYYIIALVAEEKPNWTYYDCCCPHENIQTGTKTGETERDEKSLDEPCPAKILAQP